ncbi:hypothetical protein CHU98_g8803 [Xylaria longipes]|nr:hypothetical protein CHU98_g8803 [Xylaria longipes]
MDQEVTANKLTKNRLEDESDNFVHGFDTFIDQVSEASRAFADEAAKWKEGRSEFEGESYLEALQTEDERRDYKLRAFYTLWCLREAYVKMTGEALLAEWLGDLVFQGFEPPEPGTAFAQSDDDDDDPRQIIRRHDVVFKGSKVEDANICIRSLGPDYMTCTAVRTPERKEDALGWELGPYGFLTVDEIVAHGEATLA